MSSVFGAVLCAGYGSRMRPFTEVIPKPLIPFLNTPLITYALNHLAMANISTVGINLSHLADTIPPVVNPIAKVFGLQPVYSREWEMLGTAGGVRGIYEALLKYHEESHLDPLADDDIIVVMNGDSVMNLDLLTHIEAHKASGADVSLLVREKAKGQRGTVWIDNEKKLLTKVRTHTHPLFSDAQETEYDFAGVHFINVSLLNRLKLEPGDIITELYGPMLEAGESIHVCVTEDYWAALDTPELYMEATSRCLEDPSLFKQNPAGSTMKDGLAILAAGQIDDDAKFKRPVFVGANTTIGPNTRVGSHVVLDAVELQPGAEVSNAVLYGMGAVEGEWRDCLAILGKVKALKC